MLTTAAWTVCSPSPYGCKFVLEYKSTCAEWPAHSVAGIVINTGGGYLHVYYFSPTANWKTWNIPILAHPEATSIQFWFWIDHLQSNPCILEVDNIRILK